MQICLTMSAAPILDRQINGPALRCLALVRSLAGHRRMFQTLTQSLATQLDRCTNTIRTYRDQLVAAGYIWWTTNKRTGITTIMIREAVEPPSRRAKLEAERQAESYPQGGAQFSASIKTRKILPPFQHLAEAGRRAWQKEKAEAAKPRAAVQQYQEPTMSVSDYIAFCLGQK